MRKYSLLLAFLVLSMAATSFAGTESKDAKDYKATNTCTDLLQKGTWEVEALGGYFHSPVLTSGGRRPQFDYAGGDFRLGLVVTPILFDRCPLLRGDLELLVDALGAGVTKGAGNYLAGGSLLFRYNFLHCGSRFIPYLDLGAGGLHSDAAQDRSQRLIGSTFEFLLSAEVGGRIVLTNKWSLLLEGGFQHISNANTASRNVGVNALGGSIGLGYIY